MKLLFRPAAPVVATAFALAFVSTGCARRAAEAPPAPAAAPPIEVSVPIQTEPPAVEPVEPEVTLPPDLDPAFFDYDSYVLGPAARAALDGAAKALRDRPDLWIVIEGHCDERGTTEYNLALGERRASAARDYLAAAGVNVERIRTVSYGEERPFVRGGDEASWAQNRRAHMVAQVNVN